MQRFTRIRCTVVFAAIGLTGWLAAQAMTSGQTFNIAAGSATSTLKQFASQAHVQLLFDYKAVEKLKTPAVKGQLTPTEALKQLLNDSGFTFREINDHTIAVMAPGASPASTATEQQPTPGTDAQKEGKAESSVGFLLAQATSGQASGAPPVEKKAEAPIQQAAIQEVIVTAEKRSERLQDVPVPVTAISADALVDRNQVRLQDFYTSVPALDFTTGVRGEPVLAIRGIVTGYATNPTVGVVIDDVPYGASTGLGGGFIAPDIDPSDLARVEVLRGPQGTLYGASSMGGLLKFVTVDPSTDAVTGRVQAGLSGVYNGNEAGYNVRGALNVPLSDTFAIRASGFTRRDPGYIDDPGNGTDGVNRIDASGGRVSALWRPSQDITLKVSALVQDSKRDGSSAVYLQSGLGDLQQAALRGTGDYNAHSNLFSATLIAKLGVADLTVLSGYNDNSWTSRTDNTPGLGSLAEAFLNVAGASIAEDNKTKKFTQEIRLSGPMGPRFEWLLGAFYTDEKTDWSQSILGIDPATGASVGSLIDFNFGPTKYEEYATFADLTCHVTDRFNIQIGGRESHNNQTHSESSTGPLAGPPTRISSNANAFTYLVTPQFNFSPDFMVYGRFASGYRPGGPNQLTSLTGFPRTFDADKTQNYEVGVKGAVPDHALSFDASVYYIDWKDLQLLVTDPVTHFQYTANTSRAKSQGAEFSVESRPLTGMTIAAWVAWNEAVLTEPLPPGPAFGLSGDRLPYSSPFSANVSLDQEFPLTSSVTAFAGASASYVDDRLGVFTGSAQSPRSTFPSYVEVDLRAGARYDSWTLNVFVTNATDKRGVLTNDANIPNAIYYIQPRTVGFSFAKKF